MFFVLSKILALLLEPLVHPYLLLLLAVVSKWRRKRSAARLFVCLALALPLIYAFLPLSGAPLRVLEGRFDVPALASGAAIDGIIVLGGHTGSADISASRQQPQQNQAAERLTFGLGLHQTYRESILLFSGFSGQIRPTGWSEAKTIRELMAVMKVPPDNILFEDTSRNTHENAVNSRTILVPQPGSRWILVTSANHMPRAVGAFRAAGWQGIIPYPVDFRTEAQTTSYFSLSGGMDMVRTALHEYVGLLVYRITGRSSAVMPGPHS